MHRRAAGHAGGRNRRGAGGGAAPRIRGGWPWSDRSGKFLPFDPTVSAPDLPVISGPDPVVARLLGRVQEMDPELFSRVVTASQVRGDVVLDLGGRRLWLRPDVTTEVIRAVMAAEQDLGRRGRAWAELDGRFAGQVVVRWRAG